MKNVEKYPQELRDELLDRMCIDRDGGDAPEELFDLVLYLDGDGKDGGETGTCDPPAEVCDLREDVPCDGGGKEHLSGRIEDGFVAAGFRLIPDERT